MRHRKQFLALAFAGSFLLAGCASGDSAEQPPSPQENAALDYKMTVQGMKKSLPQQRSGADFLAMAVVPNRNSLPEQIALSGLTNEAFGSNDDPLFVQSSFVPSGVALTDGDDSSAVEASGPEVSWISCHTDQLRECHDQLATGFLNGHQAETLDLAVNEQLSVVVYCAPVTYTADGMQDHPQDDPTVQSCSLPKWSKQLDWIPLATLP